MMTPRTNRVPNPNPRPAAGQPAAQPAAAGQPAAQPAAACQPALPNDGISRLGRWWTANQPSVKGVALVVAVILIVAMIYKADTLRDGSLTTMRYFGIGAFITLCLVGYHVGGNPRRIITVMVPVLTLCIIALFFGTSPQKTYNVVKEKMSESQQDVKPAVPATTSKPATTAISNAEIQKKFKERREENGWKTVAEGAIEFEKGLSPLTTDGERLITVANGRVILVPTKDCKVGGQKLSAGKVSVCPVINPGGISAEGLGEKGLLIVAVQSPQS